MTRGGAARSPPRVLVRCFCARRWFCSRAGLKPARVVFVRNRAGARAHWSAAGRVDVWKLDVFVLEFFKRKLDSCTFAAWFAAIAFAIATAMQLRCKCDAITPLRNNCADAIAMQLRRNCSAIVTQVRLRRSSRWH